MTNAMRMGARLWGGRVALTLLVVSGAAVGCGGGSAGSGRDAAAKADAGDAASDRDARADVPAIGGDARVDGDAAGDVGPVIGTGGRGGTTGSGGGTAGASGSGGGGASGSGGAAGASNGGHGSGGNAATGGGQATGGGSATGGRVETGGGVGTGGAPASGGTSGTAGTGTGGAGTGGARTGGSGTGGVATGGASTNTGGAGTGATGTGGAGTGGTGTGGAGTGGARTGGSGTGGVATGGATTNTGGAGTGATGTGGAGTGGTGTGGVGTGGAATGGRGTGGAGTGGAGTGGAGTGGAGTGGAGTGGAGTGGAGTGGQGAGATSGTLTIVAHPDDDVLFQNPELDNDIKAGKSVCTIYMTSGDGGGTADWRGREQTIRDARAVMAGLPAGTSWSCGLATYAGKPSMRCLLPGRPQISTIFLRLLDGGSDNLMAGMTVNVVANTDFSTTYTRDQMTAVMAAIQAEAQPIKVMTLDGTLAYGEDHHDHINSAILAFDVARADGASRDLVMTRGYTMAEPDFSPPAYSEPVNLSTPQFMEKQTILLVYDPSMPGDPNFQPWLQRYYPIRKVVDSGRLQNAGALCLQANGTTDGSSVSAVACAAGASQTWSANNNNTLTGPGGLCLGLDAGGAAILQTCTGGAAQRWTYLDNHQLRGAVDTCLTATGASVTAATCAGDLTQTPRVPMASQRWIR